MFNFSTFCQSVKRHWIPIAVITIVFLGLGFASSSLKGGSPSTSSSATYTAEATLYVQVYGYGSEDRQGGDYNYTLAESMAVNDVMRLVTDPDVAGVLRSRYGTDVTITTPSWIDTRTNSSVGNRYIYIDATAPDAETAKTVANEAAQMTIDKATGLVPVQSITQASQATLRTGEVSATAAGNWGTGSVVTGDDTSAAASTGVSTKKLVVFAFGGLVLGVIVFCAYDILSRRVRCADDVERLLDIPVIDVAAPAGPFTATAAAIHALMERNGLEQVVVAGASENDGAAAVAKGIGRDVASAVSFADDADAVTKVMDADAVLLVLKDAASKGAELEHAVKQLKIAGTPVLGCVFVTKK